MTRQMTKGFRIANERVEVIETVLRDTYANIKKETIK
jgi:hypothetical protein